MKIELSKNQLDGISAAKIDALEKEIRRLTGKLDRTEKKLAKLQGGMDTTKETRDRIQGIAEQLVDELQSARWAEEYNEQ